MSRYAVSVDPEVVVGWDDPLGVFFAHVYDDAGDVRVARETRDLDALEMWLAVVPNVVPSNDVLCQLRADRYAHDGWEPGPLQHALGYTGDPGGAEGPDGNIYSDAEGGL